MITLNLFSIGLLLFSLLLLVIVSGKYGGGLIAAFFSWFGGVLADPNDKQGSTKRVCLILVVVTVLLLLVTITLITKKLPNVPDSLLYLTLALVATFTGGMVLDKGIAAYKLTNGGSGDADTADSKA